MAFQREEHITLKAIFRDENHKSEYYLRCAGESVEERHFRVNGRMIIQERGGAGNYVSKEGRKSHSAYRGRSYWVRFQTTMLSDT